MLDDDEDYTEAADDENDDVDGEAGAHADAVLEGHAEPAPIERFHRTSVGMVLAAGMFGLRDVLETPKDNTPAIVEDWAGGQPADDPYVLRLDPDNPQDSIVMVRRKRDPDDKPPA